MIESIIIGGLMTSMIYALLALGFTLIYGVSGVVNLAHGTFFMIGAYMFYLVTSGVFDLDPGLGLIAATVIVGIIGALIYRILIHPVIRDELSTLVVTVCLAVATQQLVLLLDTKGLFMVPVQTIVPNYTTFWGVTLTYSSILAFGICAALYISLWIFISKAKIGKAMRAASQDLEATMLMGVNTTRVYILTMALSTALAAVAGISVSSAYLGVAYPYMWFHPLALSFAIVILGGLGSIKGTLLGGFIVGYAETVVQTLYPTSASIVTVVPMGIIVLVLILRPKGLFGKRVELEE
jgi:branched-chain amino acid transport system permease protein